MAVQTINARAMAKLVSKALGKDVNDKRVRAWVRDNVEAYDDEGYTTHAYDARLQRVILDGMTGKARTPRSKSATNGRTGKATPRKATPRKATPSATPNDGPAA